MLTAKNPTAPLVGSVCPMLHSATIGAVGAPVAVLYPLP